jgi:hypothetical protein
VVLRVQIEGIKNRVIKHTIIGKVERISDGDVPWQGKLTQ